MKEAFRRQELLKIVRRTSAADDADKLVKVRFPASGGLKFFPALKKKKSLSNVSIFGTTTNLEPNYVGEHDLCQGGRYKVLLRHMK